MLLTTRLAALVVLALALAPSASARPDLRPTGPKDVLRASFEDSLNAWRGYQATLSLVQSGRTGAQAARVSMAGAGSSFSIYPAKRPVRSSVRGARYVASAYVRSQTPGREVCLRIREWSGGALVGSAKSCMTSTSPWKRFPAVEYVVRANGNAVDVYVYEWRARAGDSFDVDAVELVSRSVSAPPQAGPPAPSAPGPEGGIAAGSAPKPVPASPTAAAAAAPAPAVSPATPAAAAPAATASASLVDHAHVALSWTPVSGASSYRIRRGNLAVGLTSGATFTDALLWPATRYDYTVEALGSDGVTLSSRALSAQTGPLPAAGFPRPFAPTSFWNTPVGPRATHERNAELSTYFRSKIVNPNLALQRWAVAVAEAHPSDARQAVPCTKYACTLGAFGDVPFPLTAAADPAGDGHLAVIDPVAGREFGMWQAKQSGTSWTASAGAAVSLAGDGVAPRGTASGNAANFPLLGGLIRPEEILQGRIDHALVFGMPGIGQGPPVCPATHNAPTTSDPNALREGQLLQLDPSLNVDALALPAWQKTIARAAQVYGMYLRDNSGSLALYAENPIARGYDAWALVGLGGLDSAPLAGFPWDRFRVVGAPDC